MGCADRLVPRPQAHPPTGRARSRPSGSQRFVTLAWNGPGCTSGARYQRKTTGLTSSGGEHHARRSSQSRSAAHILLRREPLGDRATDLLWRILLHEVDALDANLSLLRPGTAEVARPPTKDRSRLRVDEELRDRRSAKPLAIRAHDLDHVGRLTLDGNLS